MGPTLSKDEDILLLLLSGISLSFLCCCLPAEKTLHLPLPCPDLEGVFEPTFYRSRGEKVHFVALNLPMLHHAIVYLVPNFML